MKEKSRKRVPVLCLNCKKRKVKCERGRPCAGCVKNNVPHLCVYVEPDWAQTLLRIADEEPKNETDQKLEARINAQAAELRCLRAQIAQAKSALRKEERDDTPLTVLAKLSTAPKPMLKVLKNGSYLMSGFKSLPKNLHTPLYTIYLWLNIIKLDPQLTALWFRVTNLQKSYHLYKTSLLRKEGSLDGHLMRSESADSDSNSCGHQKCPVVACEFNLMLEESENLKKTPREPSVSALAVQPNGCPVERIRNSTQSSDALELLRCLQNMWGKIVGTSNSEPLNYSQLCFLISFYLDDFDREDILLSNETESCYLFSFFKADIISIFTRDLDSCQAYLNLGAISTDMSDVEVITFLRSKAIFLCMLALIVEESLDRLSERNGLSNDLMFRLQSSFPDGVPGRKFAVLSHVSDTIQFLFLNSDSPGDSKLMPDLDGLLAMVVLLLASVNRHFSLYERQNTAVDCRVGFNVSLARLLQLLKTEGYALQIWCDPSLVEIDAAENNVLGVLFCQIWCDFMRIINNAIYNLLPIFNHSSEAHDSLEYFLDIMQKTEKSAAHKRYLEGIQGKAERACQIDDLLVSLKTNYLIARCSTLVKDAISMKEKSTPGEVLTVAHFLALVSDIRALSEDISLTKLRMIRFFEAKIVLHYLEFFFKLIMFLQFEEIENTARIQQMLPELFANALDINKFLQGSQSRLAKGVNANYVLAIIADTLARISHLMSGILLRFKVEGKKEDRSTKSQFMASFSSLQTPGSEPNMLLYTMLRPNSSYAQFETSVTLAEKERVVRASDDTVLLLESYLPRDSIINKTKIWKFYMTFIRNSHEINASTFARIHEGFGPGKLLDKCPIMSGPSYEISATRGSMCPVVGVQPPKALGCPYGKRDFEQVKKEEGKCPVAHVKEESPKRAHWEIQSNSPQPYYKRFTPPLFANPPQMPASDFRPKEDMDWDSLPNFNFDFIGEEGLMLQINAGDFNNPRIENMFQ